MKILFFYIKKHWPLLVLALFLAAINQCFSLMDPYIGGKKVREMTLRRKAELVTDVGDRVLRAHQTIERPLDAHRVGIKRGRHSRILAKQLEEMRA